MPVFTKRLKEARVAARLSQEKLGILAGVEEASASARMNQYERGKHAPDFSMVSRIALALDLPEAYFYSRDDELAWLVMRFHKMTSDNKKDVLTFVRNLS